MDMVMEELMMITKEVVVITTKEVVIEKVVIDINEVVIIEDVMVNMKAEITYWLTIKINDLMITTVIKAT